MRSMIVTIGFFCGVCAFAYAQPEVRPGVSLELVGDIVTTAPVDGYDGVVRSGRAQHVTTASGNVLIVINGVRVTADSAVWHQASNEIELAGGGVRIQLPGNPTSLRIRQTR
jgi:hypothetical protein